MALCIYRKHIFNDFPKMRKFNLNTWKNNWEQLSTSLSLPISINENKKIEKFDLIKKVLKSLNINSILMTDISISINYNKAEFLSRSIRSALNQKNMMKKIMKL